MNGKRQGSTSRFRVMVTAVVLLTAASVIVPAQAQVDPNAGVGMAATPLLPGQVTVGQTFDETLSISNNSQGVGPVTLDVIELWPSCGDTSGVDCDNPDLGVFSLAPTATGTGGSCVGLNFTVNGPDPVDGRYTFTPANQVVLATPGGSCAITFAVTVLKRPTLDASTNEGLQTRQAAHTHGTATTTNPNFPPIALDGEGFGSSVTTVLAGQPSVTTTAAAPTGLGGTSTDMATLVAPTGVNVPPSPAPTGTITFVLYGPNDGTCTNTPHSTPAAVTVDHFGPPVYTSPPSNPINVVGTYRWRATYSGDLNYATFISACDDLNEQFVVAQGQPTVTTTAAAPAGLGGTSTDMATLVAPTTGAGAAPTGTITFVLYGPNDGTCSNTPHSTPAAVNVDHFGPPVYTSPPSNPINVVGTYRWRATYSGDLNYATFITACDDMNEQFVVAQGQPSITTTATGPAGLGGTSSDTATLVAPTTGVGAAPTGTITFRLFGPNDTTCAAVTPHSTATVNVDHFGPPVYNSGPSNPINAAGTYRWTAQYSGDNNYSGTGQFGCSEPSEQFVVAQGQPTITTTATGPAGLGGTSSDTATLVAPTTGVGAAPTGTITFRLFGPNDATCAAVTPHSTATVNVDHFGPPVYNSGPSNPINVVGTYRWTAQYSGDGNYTGTAQFGCTEPSEQFVVAQGQPSITTTAAGPAGLGGTSFDTATLVAPTTGVGAAPTGSITFRLFGPNDTTCAAVTPHSTATVNVDHFGAPVYNSGPSNPINVVGTYRWTAQYSGDTNYLGTAQFGCSEPSEQFVVNPAAPTITTTAAAPTGLGGTSTDAATLHAPAAGAGAAPSGTITFRLFGPDDDTCSGTVHSTSSVTVNHFDGAAYTSAPSNPINAVGTYRWTAQYSGDGNYTGTTQIGCTDESERFVVAQGQPTITTTAAGPAGLGGTSSDTATLVAPATGVGTAPSGSITFRLFGPNDTTCAAVIPHSSATVAVTHFGAPVYNSGPSNPIVAAGTYRWTAQYSGDTNYAGTAQFGCSEPSEQFIVAPASPGLTTTAAAPTGLGGTSTDTATLAAPTGVTVPPGLAPGGTITFRLYGPGDDDCNGTVHSTSEVTVTHFGAPVYSSAASNPIVAAGTYHWTAEYSGDGNYAAVGPTACDIQAETFTLARPTPTISTTATAPTGVGATSSDSALLTGPSGVTPQAPVPSGTITFRLFGPGNATCDTNQAVHSTSTVPVDHFGTPLYASAASNPVTVPGTYHWTAEYSGDGNYAPAGPTACADEDETFILNPAAPGLTTVAVPPTTLGGTTSDTAVLAAPDGITVPPAPAPGGTITFRLFGPNNPTCSLVGPVHSTATVPVTHFGQPAYASGPSNPIVASGDYHWVATYSGDGTYPAAGPTGCLDPLETFTIVRPVPTINTTATPGPLGGTSSDLATLSAPQGVTVPPFPAPTGTITFRLFGPLNLTCDVAAGVQSTLTVPVDHFGPPPYASGASSPLLQAGIYHWVAQYSGDSNYAPSAPTACSDPNETFVVNRANPGLTTTAVPPPALGLTSSDNALLTAPPGITVPPGPSPAGSITFRLYGPDNPTCSTTGAVHSTLTIPVNHFGPPAYPSGPSNPITTVGTYHWVASYTGDGNYSAAGPTACSDPAETFTVNKPGPSINTIALPASGLGGTTTDQATLFAPAGVNVPPAAAPTGTITFRLFGPNNPNCDANQAVHSTSTVNVDHFGAPVYSSSPSNPIIVNGTYHWVAEYSGDANYAAAGPTACADFAETFTLTKVLPAIATSATASAPIGGTISDTATVTGAPSPAPAPTGTVTFRVWGPNNGTCSGDPLFTLADRPLSGGPPAATASSGTITPVAPGVYRWRATYNGDVNYLSVVGECNATGETSVVSQSAATIETVSTVSVVVGNIINDTAVVKGGPGPAPAPTGTVTFRVYGPNDGNCSSAPVFISADRPLSGGPPPSTKSADFTPTVPGVYRWTATYSGDANYPSVASGCNAVNETTTVNPAPAVAPVVVPVVQPPAPTIRLDKTATPASRVEPGGEFIFDVAVTNTSPEVLTITSLTDNIYGDITTRTNSTCVNAIGMRMAPGGVYLCRFVGVFTGVAGARQTDIVTVRAVNPTGVPVSANDDATVTLTPLPVAAQQLSRTGTDVSGPAQLAFGLLALGILMLATTWRTTPGLAFAPVGGRLGGRRPTKRSPGGARFGARFGAHPGGARPGGGVASLFDRSGPFGWSRRQPDVIAEHLADVLARSVTAEFFGPQPVVDDPPDDPGPAPTSGPVGDVGPDGSDGPDDLPPGGVAGPGPRPTGGSGGSGGGMAPIRFDHTPGAGLSDETVRRIGWAAGLTLLTVVIAEVALEAHGRRSSRG